MKTTADLGKDSVRSLVLKLALPAMVAQFVNVLYSIIDRMYIGHIAGDGALALAGAGICETHCHFTDLLRHPCRARRLHHHGNPHGRKKY